MAAHPAPPLSAPTDAELIQRIIQQDQQALMELYARYGAQVYSLAVRVLRDATLAEEATQDTFLKVWRRSVDWDASKGLLSSWLLTIARYTAIDHLRRERRHIAKDPNDPASVPDLMDRRAAVGDVQWQNGQLLRELMSRLPPEQGQVIELAFFQGMTHSEMAEHLALPLGTIKTRTRLGLQKLRALWQEAVGAD